MFFDYLLYERHLGVVHSIDDQAISSTICQSTDVTNHRNPSQFWCGFCCRIVNLEKDVWEAWKERSDHIASQHFEFGQRMDSWRLPDEDSIRRLGALDGICV